MQGTKRKVAVGDRVHVELPYSEVCRHMRVAGTVAEVELVSNTMAQLYVHGTMFSFPITHGEAGIQHDDAGLWAYDVGDAMAEEA